MNIKNYLKHQLFEMSPNTVRKFYNIYNVVKYPNYRETEKCFGPDNPDKIFYVIRPRPGKVEGLMALYQDTLKQINYAEKRHFVPIVDFQNYETQYDDQSIEEKNAWLYYFKQVSPYNLKTVYNSSKVILSGLNAIDKCDVWLSQDFSQDGLNKARVFSKKYIRFSNEVNKFVNSELRNIDLNHTIGLYLRGTDYTKLKPAGHPIQPSPRQAFEIVDEMIKKYAVRHIFLTTEDYDIYHATREKYGDILSVASFDSFIKNYNDGFLSDNANSLNQLSLSPYKRGLNYLCKLIILSKCKYFVGGKTSGSWAACTFSEGFAEQYIFELGKY